LCRLLSCKTLGARLYSRFSSFDGSKQNQSKKLNFTKKMGNYHLVTPQKKEGSRTCQIAASDVPELLQVKGILKGGISCSLNIRCNKRMESSCSTISVGPIEEKTYGGCLKGWSSYQPFTNLLTILKMDSKFTPLRESRSTVLDLSNIIDTKNLLEDVR